MRTTRLFLPALAVFALSAALAEAVPQPTGESGSVAARCRPRSYTFQTVDPPFGTPGVDMAVGILWLNNWGVVTAQYQLPPDPNGLANLHGAVQRRGAWTNVDVPDAISSAPANANNRGQLVLSYQLLQDGPWRAGIYDRRGLRPFPEIPGYPGGMIVQGLNDLGRVAAVVIDASGSWHGFVGDAEHFAIVDYPDAAVTMPMGLNNRGTAVGWYVLPDGSGHGFWYRSGGFRAIDRPGCVFTAAAAINNSGAIVGSSGTAEGDWVGFVLERGRYTDIRVPGALGTNAYFINDLGQVSGIYADASGVIHGFIATPVSEEP